MAKKKLPFILTALTFASILSTGQSFAAEEVVSYEYSSLDSVFEETLLEDKKEIEDENLEIDQQETEISSEVFIEQTNYKDQNVDEDTDDDQNLEVVLYDNRNLDRLLDPAYKNEDKTQNEKKDSTSFIKDGIIYESEGKKASNKWVDIGDDRYYAGKDGKASVGLREIGKNKYYFDKNSKLVINQDLIADGGKFSADPDGKLKLIQKASLGWASLGDKSYYFGQNGLLLKGLTDLGDNRYYFDLIDGLMLKNTIVNEGIDKIHTGNNGVAHYIGWDYYNGKLGYFNEDGTYTKGLKNIHGTTYGFDSDGKIYNRQNKKINGQWYYFNKFGEASKTNGKFNTGWVGNRYYFEDGKPAEGLQVIDGKTYIFHELTLEKQRNVTKVFNHKKYRLDNNGLATMIGSVPMTKSVKGTNGQFRPGYSLNLGRKTPYFTQNDPRWKNNAYASGSFGGYGCGPTAMAMVLNRKLNRNDIYPTNTAIDAAPYTSWNGTDWQYLIEGPEVYGLKSYEVPINEKALIEAVKKNPVIIRVGSGYFINTGHYMVIDSYKDGKFIINDPFYSKKNTQEAHPFWRLKQEVTVAWEIK